MAITSQRYNRRLSRTFLRTQAGGGPLQPHSRCSSRPGCPCTAAGDVGPDKERDRCQSPALKREVTKLKAERPRKPTTRIAGYCARAASGHAAAPPSSVRNWRRLTLSMGSSPEPAVPAYRRLSMHRKGPAGPWGRTPPSQDHPLRQSKGGAQTKISSNSQT
jgi:hypothetical protein